MIRRATSTTPPRTTVPIVAILAFMLASCATLRVPEILPPPPIGAAESSGTASDVVVTVHPITKIDEFLDLFDEDLPRIGLAAIVLTVRNDGGVPIETRKLSFRLHRRDRSLGPLDSGKILERYYDLKGVRLISNVAHASARKSLDRILYRPLLLGPGGSLSGLMFFGIKPVETGSWSTGAQLVIKGFPKSGGRKPEMKLALDHAAR